MKKIIIIVKKNRYIFLVFSSVLEDEEYLYIYMYMYF